MRPQNELNVFDETKESFNSWSSRPEIIASPINMSQYNISELEAILKAVTEEIDRHPFSGGYHARYDQRINPIVF